MTERTLFYAILIRLHDYCCRQSQLDVATTGELERLKELLGALIQLYVQLISRQDIQHWHFFCVH